MGLPPAGAHRVIRPMRADERTFVRETCAKVRWPRRGVTWADWLAVHGRLIDDWLATGECLVYEQDGVVLGFVVASNDVIRCLYVKRDFRGNRFGLALVTELLPVVMAVAAYRPTPSFRRWAHLHGLAWRDVAEPRQSEPPEPPPERPMYFGVIE